tara:strand:+ start:1893 stop:3017 length:1125 start_codon:yes stop_codon:yes gene_type:complete
MEQMSKIKLLPWQVEGLQVWEENKYVGAIEAPTGSGKTFLGLEAISLFNKSKVLIIVHTEALLHQWKIRIKEFLDINVGLLGGGYNINDELVTIAIINSVRDLKGKAFDLLIIDELHHLASQENIKLLHNNSFQRILGLSATVERTDERHELLELPIIYKYSQEKAIKEKILAPYQVLDIPVDLTEEDKQLYRQYTTFISQWYPKFAGVVYRPTRGSFNPIITRLRKEISLRKKMLLNNPLKLPKVLELVQNNKEKKMLIFCEYVETAENLSKLLNDKGYMNMTYTLKTKKQQTIHDFIHNKFKILIAVRCLDEGMDVKDADMIIIVGGSSIKRQQIQRIGRALRYIEGKESIIYQLYTLDTKEEDWIKKRRII